MDEAILRNVGDSALESRYAQGWAWYCLCMRTGQVILYDDFDVLRLER